MRSMSSNRRIVFAGTMIFVLVLGASALFSKVQAGCFCPAIYAPVTCDHNKTYPNQCEADCHHAKNCVPSGVFAAR